MHKRVCTLLAFGLLLSCGLASARDLTHSASYPPPPSKMCLCDNTIIDPVCGSNGVTYNTPCEADCAGVKWRSGPCQVVSTSSPCSSPPPPKKMCLCDNTKIQPVCGANGLTYMTPCEADCADVKWRPGPCLNGAAPHSQPESPFKCIITCPNIFQPVCGANGVTYPNQCFAACAGQTKWQDGRCANDCVCPKDYKPVCGYNNKTYSNACEALCQGTYVKYNGTCDQAPQAMSTDAGCPDIYLPVCADGKTYPNACVARLNKVTTYSNGPCADTEPLPPCGCPPILAPVCGQNNVTYTNKCFAECSRQTTVAYDHPCTDQCAPLFGACLLEPVVLTWNEIPKHQPCCAGSKCTPTSGSPIPGRLWGVCAPIVY